MVNRCLLIVVLAQAITGIVSLLTGQPVLRGVFDLHRLLAVLFVLLLGFKASIVWRALRKRRPNRQIGLSALLAGLILGANLISWLVAGGALPDRLPFGVTWLSVHVYLGLAALPLLIVHAWLRWPITRIPVRPGRRAVIAGLPLAALGLWIGGGRTRLLDRPVAGNPRFTGSIAARADSGNDFPVTNWLFDDPPPFDPATWRLTVGGRVAAPFAVGLRDLNIDTTRAATLDCTGGWYTDQVWSGIGVAGLIDRAGVDPGATAAIFRSVTGHQVELPLAEARAGWLATRVGGEPLDHAHGAPIRLIAPDRRGVAWVKWLATIEIV